MSEQSFWGKLNGQRWPIIVTLFLFLNGIILTGAWNANADLNKEFKTFIKEYNTAKINEAPLYEIIKDNKGEILKIKAEQKDLETRTIRLETIHIKELK